MSINNFRFRGAVLIRCFLLVLVAAAFLIACEPKKYIDVTDQEPYSSVVGYNFKAKKALLAIGVTFDPNYKGDADYIFLMSRPGISGPEVTFRKTLPDNVQFRVVGILKSDWLHGGRTMYQVEFPNNQMLGDAPILIDAVGDITGSNKGLSPDDFAFIGK